MKIARKLVPVKFALLSFFQLPSLCLLCSQSFFVLHFENRKILVHGVVVYCKKVKLKENLYFTLVFS